MARSSTRRQYSGTEVVRAFAVLLALVASSAGAGTPELDNAIGAHMRNGMQPETVPQYRWSKADLNGDAAPDAVVLLVDPEFCGSGGCAMLIFKGKADGYEFMSLSTVTREPIFVLPETIHGWHTLSVLVAGGGLVAHQVLMRFDGESYPENPTLQEPALVQGLDDATRLRLE